MFKAGLLVLIVVFAVVAVLIYRSYVERQDIREARPFYGLVIDQDGNPVAGAEVKVFMTGFTYNLEMMSLRPDSSNQTRFSVFTGSDGKFEVKVPRRYVQLTIEAVIRDGHDWVFDLMWTIVGPWASGDNRQYMYAGEHYYKVLSYNPDSTRPAIFPLHLKGSLSPATMPSRGGADNKPPKWVNNQPTPLLVPSAGPDAPKSRAELDHRLLIATEKYHTEAPARRASGVR